MATVSIVVPKPTPTDGFPTPTSDVQAAVEKILSKHLPLDEQTAKLGSKLNTNAHMQYLVRNMIQGFPERYTSQDASQPWLLFWTLQAFSILQVALDPDNKQKAIDTIMAWQHPEGGFGGGPGQSAHLLATYASVCALAIVGRPGPRGGWDQINREKVYNFFMSLKQPDGSFLVTHHAEVDVRGTYCLLVVAYLLNILTPELVAGTPAFIASCQTYEGGFASASFPISPEPPFVRRTPLGEAHGGYTFCALASWVLLQPYLSVEAQIISPSSQDPRPQIHLPALRRWLVQMQGARGTDLGGFRGRTNKLVDGCYAWWVGGAFGVLECLGGATKGQAEDVKEHDTTKQETEDADSGVWDDVDDSLFDRASLQEYVLYAGQHPAGGLRDKPPKSADSYHTLYSLSGLSAAQHHFIPSYTRREAIERAWVSPSSSKGSEVEELQKRAFVATLGIAEDKGAAHFVGGTANRINATHPLFNLTLTHSEAVMSHFYGQTLPSRSN